MTTRGNGVLAATGISALVAAVVLSPMITPIVGRIGARTTVLAGFAIMTAAFAVLAFTTASWTYAAFVLPLVALAVGMSLQNGPASSAATACVPAQQVGAAAASTSYTLPVEREQRAPSPNC